MNKFKFIKNFQKNGIIDSKINHMINFKKFNTPFINSFYEKPENKGIEIKDLNYIQLPMEDISKRQKKYVRSLLVSICSEIFGLNKSEEKIAFTGALVEIIHNNTLVIDDIQDKSEIRRGEKAIHLKYGIDTALNSMSFYSNGIIQVFADTVEIKDEARRLQLFDSYFRMYQDLYLGLCWDVEWHKNLTLENVPSLLNFKQMIYFKTCRLLNYGIEVLKIVYPEINNKQAKVITRLLNDFGLAFQINDDMINLFNKEYAKLKGFAEDITEKKLSFLILTYLQSNKIQMNEKQEFLDLFNRDNKTFEEKNYLVNVLEKTGIKESVQTELEFIKKRYLTNINNSFDPNHPGVEDFKSVFDYLVENQYYKQN